MTLLPCLLAWFYWLGFYGPYSTGKVLIVGAVGLWLALESVYVRRFDKSGLVYVGVIVLSGLVSLDPWLTIFGTHSNYHTGLVAVFLCVPFWCCVGPRDRRGLELGLRIAAVGLAAVGIGQRFGVVWVTPFDLAAGFRAYSTMGSPVYAGQLAAVLMPLTRGWLEPAFLAVFLWATGSRGAWLAAGVGLLFREWPRLSGRARFYVGSGIIAGLLAALCVRPPSDLGRAVMWRSAVEAFSMRPWLGWGTGSYLLIADVWRNGAWQEAFGYTTQDHAHNVFFEAISSGGIIGLAGLMALWVMLWTTRLRRTKAALIVAAVSALVNPLSLPVKATVVMIAAMGAPGRAASQAWNFFVKCFVVAAFCAAIYLVHLDRMIFKYGALPWSESSRDAAISVNILREARRRSEFKF